MLTKPYEYVAVHTEKDDDGKDKKSTLITNGLVMAKNEQAALIQIARELPPEYSDKIDDVEIVIRPF